jgi:predicted lysophospholipase L1 biosynthesis ABC-type transport system permease subunit
VKKDLPPTFWIEVAVSAIAALFAALTALRVDWIEQILPLDLDHHTGSLEWKLAAAVSLAAALLSTSTFREWRKSLRAA